MIRRSIPFFFLTILFALHAAGATMQWSFTHPRPAKEDWLFAIVPTSDGGYLASGYTTKAINATDTRRRGTILKLDARRNVQWESVTPDPSPLTEKQSRARRARDLDGVCRCR